MLKFTRLHINISCGLFGQCIWTMDSCKMLRKILTFMSRPQQKQLGCSTAAHSQQKTLFHIFITWNISSKNPFVKPFSYVFADLTLCGVIIRKRGQLKMERGNKRFFQIHTEKCHDGLLKPQCPNFTTPHYEHIVVMFYQYMRKIHSWKKTLR